MVGCGTTSEPTIAVPTKLIADPIVEKAIRQALEKPTGELTRVDLEKVTYLNLKENQLAKVPEGLGCPFCLGYLLTKAQIDELKKALPKFEIISNPKK